MKPLTSAQIKFIKHTQITPTIFQCDEWERTIWKHNPSSDEIAATCADLGICATKDEALTLWEELLYDFNRCEDGISLEDAAIYLFRTFLTPDEMEKMLEAPSIDQGLYGYNLTQSGQWLRDWKYFNGYRKWDDCDYLLEQALDESYVMYVDDDGDIYYVHEGIE